MAKGYLSIEITPVSIRYLCLRHTVSGYEIIKSGVLAHTLNTLIPGDLTKAIKEIISKEKISPKQLFVNICRQGTLVRQMTMPRLKKQEMDEVISAEIEKTPFFASNRYDFIYSFHRTVKEKHNVIFAAIDENTLHYVIDECRKLRLPFEHLEITPLNIKDIVPYKKTDNPSQVVMVIHDQMSYVMMMHVKETRYVYQSSTGMQHLCPNKNGQIVESVFSNFAGEIHRVIKSYMSEHKLETNPKLWVIWDTAYASGLDEMFKQKLDIESSILNFDQLSQFKVVRSKETANPIHALNAVPVIIHVEKFKEQFALNHFFRAQNTQRYLMRWLLGVFLFVGLVGTPLGMKAFEFYKKTEELKSETLTLANDRQELITATKDLYRQRDEYMRIRQGLLDQATFVKNLNRVSWSEVLSVVADEMPEDLALTSFKFNEQGNVAFFGDALAVEVVSELIRRIDTSAILQDGKFDFLSEKIVEETKIFSFGILAQLKNKSSGLEGDQMPAESQGQEAQGEVNSRATGMAEHLSEVQKVNNE